MLDTTTIQFFTIIIFVFVFAAFSIAIQLIYRSRDPFDIRTIDAYELITHIAGEGIESNRPVNLAMGGASLGDTGTVLSLATAEFFYHVAREVAIGDVSPIITVSDTSVIPLAQDTLRRAYHARELGHQFRANNVRWYPSGSRSMTYAAVISAIQDEDRVSGNILSGSFGIEMSLMLDNSYRRGQQSVAYSDLLEGQAVAFALANEAILGEELYVAGAYLEGKANQRAIAITTDLFRWIVILAILILFIARAVEGF